MEKILSKTNPKVKLAASLKEKKFRYENEMFLIEGRKMLEMGLKANLVDTIFTTVELRNVDPSVKIYVVTDEIIEKIAFHTLIPQINLDF